MAELARSPRELRDELEALVRDDLIGPVGGSEEELLDAPIDRYLLGLLAPRMAHHEHSLAPADNKGDHRPAVRSGAAALEDPLRQAAEAWLAGDDEDDDPAAAEQLPEDELAAGALSDSG